MGTNMKSVGILGLLGIALSATTATAASTGGDSSGGGIGVVCRGNDNRIESIEMLDTYESRIRRHLEIPSSDLNYELLLEEKIQLLSFDTFFQRDFIKALGYVREHIEFLPPGVSIAPGIDLGNEFGVVVPDGCELEAVGFYEATGTLLISRSLFDSLDSVGKAAFFVHEAFYKMERHFSNAKNSASTRRFVGQIFSTEPGPAKLQALVQDAVYPQSYKRLNIAELGGRGKKFLIDIKNPTGNPFSVTFQCEKFASLGYGEFEYGYQSPENDSLNEKSFSYEFEENNCEVFNVFVSPQWGRDDRRSFTYRVRYGSTVLGSGRLDGSEYSSSFSLQIALY